MEPITWTDDFSVGVAAIDAQHKTLIAMINQLIREPSAAARSETVNKLLSEMSDYALLHFQAEETLMAAHNYPHIEEQITMHRAFHTKTIRFCIDVLYRDEALPGVMLTYLRDWWTHHILEEDKKYSAFFRERGVT